MVHITNIGGSLTTAVCLAHRVVHPRAPSREAATRRREPVS